MPDLVKPATFDFGPQPPIGTDGYILRHGKIFESGEWPDKGYSMTAEELTAAAAAFSPVPLDLEHMPTVLDGKLGELRAVEVKGTELFGTVAVPSWLDALLDEGARKVSCTWDKATKKLTGLAIVRTPRIDDAALYAAFSEFAGKRHSAQDLLDLQTIHDLTTKQGATCAAAVAAYSDSSGDTAGRPPGTGTKEPRPMNLWDKLQAALSGHEAEDTDKGTPQAEKAAGFSVDPATFAAIKAKADAHDALQPDLAAFREQVTADFTAAHVRLHGKAPEESQVAAFSDRPIAEVRDLTKKMNQDADALFGIGKDGAQRQSLPSRAGQFSVDSPTAGGTDKTAETLRQVQEAGRLANGTAAAGTTTNGNGR